MTAIPWTVLDPDTIERMIAVGLCRRHERARRVKPSQGDGGLDILVPTSVARSQLTVDNYQVKKFADGLDDSRKRQIKKSLARAIATHNDDGFGYTISTWFLTLPMDLTREQEKWLFDVAEELNAPFDVEVFGLTEIENLLLDAPNIREYYLGDGMDKVSQILGQMTTLTVMHNLTADPTKVLPNDVEGMLGDLHRGINAADPHFAYDYQVSAEPPDITLRPGLIASVLAKDSPDAPFVTWHIYIRYDTALEDRPIPGSYTVYPDRMTPEQRQAWDRWREYGTPVVLEGNVVEDLTMDLPGGLGTPLPGSDKVLRMGPAAGEHDDEPITRGLWVIEDADANRLAERMFSFRLKGRGVAGGEHREGTDADHYLAVDLFTKVTTSTGGSMQINLHMVPKNWIGEPVQRIFPAIQFCGAWGKNNQLRHYDEFGFQGADETITLEGEPPIPAGIVETVGDLVRISNAIKRSIPLPENIGPLAAQRRTGLRIIADAVTGGDTEVGVGELVLWYEDAPGAFEDLTARAAAGELTVPWTIPFGLLEDDYEFNFVLSVSGAVELEPVEPESPTPGRKGARIVAPPATRGRLHWPELSGHR